MSEFDYETIKQMAKDNGIPVTDLLALSPSNDPFYVGSPGQMQKAKWFADIYVKAGSPEQCHIRRVHYWFVSQHKPLKPDGTVYENTTKDWGFLTLASKYARYAGLVPLDNIIDRRNPNPIINLRTWADSTPEETKENVDAASIIEDVVNKFYCWNSHNTQAFHLEIWCEKSTMNDVLEPIASNYGINLVTGLGELSITAVYLLIKRISEINKPVRIFYISDMDPAGECMPLSIARKIEYFIRNEGVQERVRLKQIMLTTAQCKHYNLPRTPIKETEKRKDGFEDRLGTGATELDALEALHPGEMGRILKEHIKRYIDIEKMREIRSKNQEVMDKVQEFLKDKITDVLSDLDLTEYDDYEPPKQDPDDVIEDDSPDNWLYDSDLDYPDQMNRYKEWRQKTE